MAKKASPTIQAIQPNNAPAKQLFDLSRHKPNAIKTKNNSGARKGSRFSKEEAQHIKEQLAQREADLV